MTVSGVNFGAVDLTASSSVGATPCQTLSWASASSVLCVTQVGDGTAVPLCATVTAVSGTRTASFSFDGARTAFNFDQSIFSGPRETR